LLGVLEIINLVRIDQAVGEVGKASDQSVR
jgi:hypothetical protein